MANQGALIGRTLGASYDDSPTIFPGFNNDFGDGMYLFQGNEAQATRNRAPGGVGTSLTKVGDVVFNGAYVSGVPMSAYFESLHAEVGTYTAWGIIASDDTFVGGTHQPAAFGNFNGSSGSSIWINNHSSLPAPAARLRNNMYTTGGNNQAIVNVVDMTKWTFVVSKVSASISRIEDKTNGFSGDAATPTGTRVLAARNMRFLSTYSPSLTGTIKAAALGYLPSRILTDAEINGLYALMKAYMAQPGIGITI